MTCLAAIKMLTRRQEKESHVLESSDFSTRIVSSPYHQAVRIHNYTFNVSNTDYRTSLGIQPRAAPGLGNIFARPKNNLDLRVSFPRVDLEKAKFVNKRHL